MRPFWLWVDRPTRRVFTFCFPWFLKHSFSFLPCRRCFSFFQTQTFACHQGSAYDGIGCGPSYPSFPPFGPYGYGNCPTFLLPALTGIVTQLYQFGMPPVDPGFGPTPYSGAAGYQANPAYQSQNTLGCPWNLINNMILQIQQYTSQLQLSGGSPAAALNPYGLSPYGPSARPFGAASRPYGFPGMRFKK